MSAKSAAGQDGALIRVIALMLGIFILADSASQLWQAANGVHLGNRNWRITNLRLLFTQVTPILIGLLLVGQYLTRKGRWRGVGVLAFVLAASAIALGSIYFIDASVLLGTLDGPALGQLKRTTAQVLVSAFALGLALMWMGVKSLRVEAAPS